MKLKKLFVALMAAAVAFVACEQDEDLGRPSVKVDPVELSFEQGDGSQTIQLTATRDWIVTGSPEWVGLSKAEGKASLKAQEITVSVTANSGHDRSAALVVNIGFAEKVSITVNQKGAQGEVKKGNGSLEDPYTVAGVIEYVKSLGSDVTSPGEVFVKGKVASITEEFNTQYGNGNFTIADEVYEDGTSSETFTCYRVLYLGNRKWKSSDPQIALKDEVVVCGKVVLYKGNTPETSQGSAFVYSHNGKNEGGASSGGGGNGGTAKGAGTQADPYNPAGAAAYAASLGSDVESSGDVYIKGKISKIASNGTFTDGGTYGNASFYIADATDGTGEFYVFRTLYLGNKKFTAGNTDIKVGDEVVICGKVVNYKGNTPETVANKSYLYSLNGKTEDGGSGGGNGGGSTGGDQAKGTGTQADPYNAAGAIAAASSLAADAKTDNDVFVAGKISSIKYTFSAQYGTATFNISDDGTTNGSQFTCYSVLYLGNKAWVEGDTQIAVGDEVVVCGKLTNYKGDTPETASKEAYLYSLKSNGGGSGNGGGNDSGNGGGQGSDDGTTVTFSKDQLAAAADKGAKVNMNDVVSFTNSSSYSGNVYELRIYKGQTFTVSAASGYVITGITMTCSASGAEKYGPGSFGSGAPSGYSYDGNTGTWAGSAESVVFTATDNQVRVTELKVGYAKK